MGQFFAYVWEEIWAFLTLFFNNEVISHVLDVLVVAFLIYKLIQLVRETRAESLVKGFLLLALCYGGALLLDMKLLTTLVTSIFQFGIIALMIVFQPELRRALERVGRSQFKFFSVINGRPTMSGLERTVMMTAIDAVSAACVELKRQKMGALIVFERAAPLGEVVESGTVIQATPSAELLVNLFFNKAPLHDGAVIVRGGEVYAAGCILPLTQNIQVESDLGTRHRAALGLSEESDALVVVVSEETGIISLVRGGMMTRNFTAITLKATLESLLISAEQEEDKTQSVIQRWFQRKGKDERKKDK